MEKVHPTTQKCHVSRWYIKTVICPIGGTFDGMHTVLVYNPLQFHYLPSQKLLLPVSTVKTTRRYEHKWDVDP